MDSKIKMLLLKQKAGEPLSRVEKAELFNYGMSGGNPAAIDPIMNAGSESAPYVPGSEPRDAIMAGDAYREKAYQKMARPPEPLKGPEPIDEDVWAELTANPPAMPEVRKPASPAAPQFQRLSDALNRKPAPTVEVEQDQPIDLKGGSVQAEDLMRKLRGR